jgi:hypothetical protein
MWLCRMIAGISGQPSQKLRRFCPGVSEDFREDTATKVFPLMGGNRCRASARMAKELVATSLPDLPKSQILEEANDLARADGM